MTNLIKYVVGRLDYYENARRAFMQLGLGMVGFSLAIMAAPASAQLTGLEFYVKICIFVNGIILFTGGILIVALYVKHTSPKYPSKYCSGIFEWYYEPQFEPIPKGFWEYLKLPCIFSGKGQTTKNDSDGDIDSDRDSAYRLDIERYIKRFVNAYNLSPPTDTNPQNVSDGLSVPLSGAIEELFILHIVWQYKKHCMEKMARWILVTIGLVGVCIAITIVTFLITHQYKAS
jgi:hypothetical protein